MSIVWDPTPQNWVKVNIDDAFKINKGQANGGGLIQNYLSGWLGGFSCNLGNHSYLEAKSMKH